jgi:hypothetical protein
MDKALAVLCRPDSTIPPYVRCVEIGGSEDMGQEICQSLRQLPPLSAVENLSLHYFRWDSQTLPFLDTLFPFFRNLKTLQISSVTFETLHIAFEFLSSATSLECLRLGEIWGEKIDAVSLTQFPLPPLKQITFERRFQMLALFDWLYLGQPVASVNSVTLHVKFVQTICAVSGYLQALGPVLEHLVIIGFGCDDDRNLISMPVNILLAHSGNI